MVVDFDGENEIVFKFTLADKVPPLQANIRAMKRPVALRHRFSVSVIRILLMDCDRCNRCGSPHCPAYALELRIQHCQHAILEPIQVLRHIFYLELILFLRKTFIFV